MAEEIYKTYRIKLWLSLQPDGKWAPLGMVSWQEDNVSFAQPIACEELHDTRALADASALERAKARVDAKEQ